MHFKVRQNCYLFIENQSYHDDLTILRAFILHSLHFYQEHDMLTFAKTATSNTAQRLTYSWYPNVYRMKLWLRRGKTR